ncbi:type II/IV secretion system ATPase subunit [Candidatus Woesearchaeota archaeon]|nr:type II/IV secretion system ATPase subunit [Candidatus Woesearchaeota archaeon]
MVEEKKEENIQSELSLNTEQETSQIKTGIKKSELLFQLQENVEIPTLPDIADKKQIDIRYPVLPPYAYIHLHWDEINHELVYDVEEPVLDEYEQRVLKILEEGVKELINISFIRVKEKNLILEYLEKNIKLLLSELTIRLTRDSFIKIMYFIYRNFVGFNEIEAIMQDYFIEDIECNGSETPIYIVHRKFRNLRTNIVFKNNALLATFVEKLAQKAGKYISYSNPLLDGRLPDGSRVNATYTQDISSRGPTFTIRKFTKDPWSPIKMMEFRTISPEMLAYLWIAIEHESSIMIVGGTGSGKTSMLNALCFFIPQASRIVSIEDTRELNLAHENWLPSVSREGVGLANIMGQKHGEVSLFDLLKESFRQRPDYVIVGEIRGKEAYVLFQGMASGHPSFGTMHAESVETMIRRLETEPINLSPALISSLDILCIMVPAKIGGKPVRRMKEITEIVNVDEELGKVQKNVPFIWNPATDKFYFKSNSTVFKKIVEKHGISEKKLIEEFRKRSLIIMEMYKRKIFDFQKVQEIIHRYYKAPELVLKEFGIK